MVISKSLRHKINPILHKGYLGNVKIKTGACKIMHLSGINGVIKNIINSSETCQELQNKLQNKDEPPIPHNILHTPWSKVDIDS